MDWKQAEADTDWANTLVVTDMEVIKTAFNETF